MSGLPSGAIYFMCCVLFLVAPSLLWLVCNMIPTVRESYPEQNSEKCRAAVCA